VAGYGQCMRRWPRPIDETLHGATDYQVGALLTTIFPRLAGISGTDSARQIRTAGAIHAGYSVFTNYTLGVVKVIPYKAHLALDLAGALALGATPFVTGQWKKGRRQWVPHVGLAAFELMSLALSDPTGAGNYKADPERAREKNALDPREAINGRPAVVHAT
jgi:hypothetical protein